MFKKSASGGSRALPECTNTLRWADFRIGIREWVRCMQNKWLCHIYKKKNFFLQRFLLQLGLQDQQIQTKYRYKIHEFYFLEAGYFKNRNLR